MSVCRVPSAKTRGILVDRRCWSVDVLENLLTLGRQAAIFRAVLDAAGIQPGERLLDVGCGTGMLVIAASQRLGDAPGGVAHGIDATAGMIARARARAGDDHANVHFHVGAAEDLPFPDAHFDVVTSTLLFHHLPADVQHQVMAEIVRVLRPGGRFVVADYAQPHGLRGYVASFPHRMNFYEYVRPQLHGSLDRLLERYFPYVETARRFLGYIPVLRVRKPTQAAPIAAAD